MRIQMDTNVLRRVFVANTQQEFTAAVLSMGGSDKDHRAVVRAWQRLQAGDSGFTATWQHSRRTLTVVA